MTLSPEKLRRIGLRDDRLDEIVATMDVPEARRDDYGWLMRNVLIGNGAHPHAQEAARRARDLHRLIRAVEARVDL